MAEEQVGGFQRLWSADNHYTLRQVASRNVCKFNTTATDYLLSLSAQSKEQPLLDHLGHISDSLEDKMAMVMADNDLILFVLQSRSLDYRISLPFMPRHELNADRIMSEAQHVLQSNEQVSLQDGMQAHVGMPQGGILCIRRKIMVSNYPSSWIARSLSFP